MSHFVTNGMQKQKRHIKIFPIGFVDKIERIEQLWKHKATFNLLCFSYFFLKGKGLFIVGWKQKRHRFQMDS